MDFKPSRGRPKTVDEKAVRQAVLNLFWEKGYSGTSLSDLSEAAAISRPSLYELLGDKQAMFLGCVDMVEEQLDEAMGFFLSAQQSLAVELQQFFKAAIAIYVSGDQPRGCLIMCTTPAEAAYEPTIRDRLRATIELLDNAFKKRFQHAEEFEDVNLTAPPHALAQQATATLQSLALRARSGESTEDLNRFASDAVTLLCGAKNGC